MGWWLWYGCGGKVALKWDGGGGNLRVRDVEEQESGGPEVTQ